MLLIHLMVLLMLKKYFLFELRNELHNMLSSSFFFIFIFQNPSLVLSGFFDCWHDVFMHRLDQLNFRFSTVTVGTIVSPKSLHNFKGCLSVNA